MSEPLTPAEREAIRARVMKITPEDWAGSSEQYANTEARTAILRLLDDLERCQEERDALVAEEKLADRLAEALRRVERDVPFHSGDRVRAVLASYNERRRG